MAINDPSAIKFSNENLRPLADTYAQFHKAAKEACFLWQAKGVNALIPNDPAVIVMDTAVASVQGGPDGRTIITGADLNALIGFAAGFVADNEANGNAKILLVGKVAVNP